MFVEFFFLLFYLADSASARKVESKKKVETSETPINISHSRTARAVETFSLTDGRLVAKYVSAREAQRKTGATQGAISLACIGKKKSLVGVGWRFSAEQVATNSKKRKRSAQDDDENSDSEEAPVSASKDKKCKPLPNEATSKPVESFSLKDGTILGSYPSVMEAHRKTGFSNISNVCHGKRDSSGKLGWRFSNQKHISQKSPNKPSSSSSSSSSSKKMTAKKESTSDSDSEKGDADLTNEKAKIIHSRCRKPVESFNL